MLIFSDQSPGAMAAFRNQFERMDNRQLMALKFWLWVLGRDDRYRRQELAHACVELAGTLNQKCALRPSCCTEILNTASTYIQVEQSFDAMCRSLEGSAPEIVNKSIPDACAFDHLSASVNMHEAGYRFGIATSGDDPCIEPRQGAQPHMVETNMIVVENGFQIAHGLPGCEAPYVYVTLKTAVPSGVPFDSEHLHGSLVAAIARAFQRGSGKTDWGDNQSEFGDDDFVAP